MSLVDLLNRLMAANVRLAAFAADLDFERKHPRGDDGRWIRAELHEVQYKDKKGNDRTRKEWRMPGGGELPSHVHEKIPPSWTNVEIAASPDEKYHSRGVDAKGRMQHRRSKWFASHQDKKKWARVAIVRTQVQEMLKKAARESDRDTADVFSLVATMGLRPGSTKDTGASHKGYGATTLLGEHVKQDADGSVILEFVPGKKHGQTVRLPVGDHRLADMLLSRKRAAGDGPLFDTTPERLRSFVKGLGRSDFKAKDLRTAIGTETASAEIGRIVQSGQTPKSEKELKATVAKIATMVASILGNTPAVALESYIDPSVWLPLKGDLHARLAG